jgi:anti-sigma factor RsiW
MTHLDDESLNALIDGAGGDAAEDARLHAAACAKCGERLERLRGASAAFRRSGARELPAGLAARAKAAAQEPQPEPLRVRLAWNLVYAGVALILVLAGGAAMKRTMPDLFSQIQGMISGAASSMGSGPSK